MMKFFGKTGSFLLIMALCLSLLVGCADTQKPDTPSSTPSSSDTPAPSNDPTATPSSSSEATPSPSSETPTPPVEPVPVEITFNGKDYTVSDKETVVASGNVLTIVKAGLYRVSGTLDDAQLRISVAKEEQVDIIFAGINITCKTSAPFYVESADKVRITLEKGTDNVLTDASNYVLAAGVKKPNACLYSSDDLLIKGSGSLTVNANYNNGIGVKNDLKIKDGNITVNAPNNAIKGNGSITVEGGTIHARGADGFKSDSIMEGKGFISILGGTISIVAGDDGLQAESAVTIAAGASVTINAADKDINCDGTVSVADNTLISK